MTVKEKQKTLKDYNFLIIELADLQDSYDIAYTNAIRITQNFGDGSGSHSSGNNDKLASNCAKLYEITKKIDKTRAKIQRINKAINQLPFYHRKLIKLIDIDHVSVYRASKILNRNYASVKLSHDKALENLRL